MTRRGPLFVLTSLTLLCASSSEAHAQNKPIRPSAEQVDHYVQGHKAFAAESYEEAAEHYRAALALGELEVFHLALGRTLQRLGDCAGARASFDRVQSAPRSQGSSPKEIATRLDTYRTELDAECRARDLGALLGARSDALAGQIDQSQRADNLRRAQEHARDEARHHAQSTDETAVGLGTRGPPDESRALPWIPIGALGAGVALVGTALVLTNRTLPTTIDDFEAARRNQDPNQDALAQDITSLQTTSWVLLISGSALAITGGAWLVWELGDEESAPVSIGLSPGPRHLNLGVSGVW